MKKIFVIFGVICSIFLTGLRIEAASSNNKATALYNTNVQSMVYIETQDASGSGIIVKDDGTLVTCFHVIANADHIIVKLKDGSIYSVNGFRYINPLSDVAILTLDTTRKFKPITINSANNFNIGEKIYTISNPQGLEFVFSDGMINQSTKDYIQFSAPISGGSSGGALLNKKGNLLGIITSQLIPSEAQNINFALPNEYFASKINNPKIVNTNDLNWTEFLVEHADEEQFKVYTDYAINNENFSMLYKYFKPFMTRDDIPDELYPTLGYMALWAYFTDENEDNLKDSLKYFEIAYNKKQNEEAALFALTIFSGVSGNKDTALKYLKTLHEKYPKSFEKFADIAQEGDKCVKNDDDCFTLLGLEAIIYLGELLF